MILKTPLLFLVLLATAPAAPVLLEAETDPQGTVTRDPSCAGGAYVTATDQAYHPVFKAELPADLPSSVTLHIRRKGAAVQLKGIVNGQQSELAWDWSTTGSFRWTKLGPFERDKLGNAILLIRGEGGTGVDIDAVVISGEENPDLESLLPPLPSVALTVDWTRPGKALSRDQFGLNLFGGLDPEVSNHPQYRENLIHMNPGILRIHNAGMVGDAAKSPVAWVDYQNKCWLKERVLAALAPLRDLPTRIIININCWPDWMDRDGDRLLDIDQHDAFARFSAQLVEIVNHPAAGKPVLWWEITNEMDDRYHKSYFEAKKPDRLDELAAIYLKSAKAMREADPRIRTGGPSTTNSYNMDFHRRFIVATAPLLDFYSMHLYLTGSRDTSDEEVFARSEAASWPLEQVRGMLDGISPDRRIELLMDEYNINWDWQQKDQRMTDWRSAVWDAAFCISSIAAGADGTAAWNECDGAYGKTATDHSRRPAAESFHLINSTLPGAVVPTSFTASKEAGLRVVATRGKDGGKAILLVNIGSRPRTVTGVTGSATIISQQEILTRALDGKIFLPALSLAVIDAR